MAPPESPYSAPRTTREAGTCDSVKYPGNGSTTQGMFMSVDGNKATNVTFYLVFIITGLLKLFKQILVINFFKT